MVHVKPKRPLAPVPYLQSIINPILNANTEVTLIPLLEDFAPPHSFEKTEERNLINWYKLLNHFDVLLERYVSRHNIIYSSSQDSRKSCDRSKSSLSRQKKVQASSHAVVSEDSAPSPAIDPSPPSDESLAGVQPRHETEYASNPSSKLILSILRVTHRIIRNATHDTRHIYNSLEHLCALLSEDNFSISLLALEILYVLLQRSPKLRGARSLPSPELIDRLLELSVGWGSRENGLSVLECCSSKNERALPPDGSRVRFKFVPSKGHDSSGKSECDSEVTGRDSPVLGLESSRHRRNVFSVHTAPARGTTAPITLSATTTESDPRTGATPSVLNSGSSCVLTIDDVRPLQYNERWLLTDFATRNKIPKHALVSLLFAYRRAKMFRGGRIERIKATIVRLNAISALFHIQPPPSKLHSVVAKDPELCQDLVSLMRADSKDGVEDIPVTLRVAAVRCLTAISLDRHRVQTVISAIGVKLHHGALATSLRAELSILISSLPTGDDSNATDKLSSPANPNAFCLDQERSALETKLLSPADLATEFDRCLPVAQHIHLTESLLGLVYCLAVSSGSSGATALANSGVLGMLTPLLRDFDSRHARVVPQAIRAMQGILEGSSQSVGNQLFRDLNGLTLVSERIAAELEISGFKLSEEETELVDAQSEAGALEARGETFAFYELLGKRQMTVAEALEHQPPSSSSTSRGHLPHSKWTLLRALHQLLLASVGSGGSEVRQLVVASRLPEALRKILGQPFWHGGILFQSAAAITTDIAHAEPATTSELVKAGLANTVLRVIKLGLPPCGEAVRCVPNLLAALCLAPSARDAIVGSTPLKQYLLRLATPFYTRALHGDIPVYIGSALDELMRHVEALRPSGNDAMIEYLKMADSFVNADNTEVRKRGSKTKAAKKGKSASDVVSAMEYIRESNGKMATSCSPDEAVSPDEVLLDKMKLAVASSSCRLVGFAQGSSEHQEGIVSGGGLRHLINLRNASAMSCAEASVRDGYQFSRHYPTPAMATVSLQTSLRNFSSRHGSALLTDLCAVTTKDAFAVLKLSDSLGEVWLAEEEQIFAPPEGQSKEERTKIRRSLCVALRKLRVDITLLNGLSRGGPGSSTGLWENAGGSKVASIVSTVERAARFHLAVVYTGLTLSAAATDGDLNTACVTAAADPELSELQSDQALLMLGDLDGNLGLGKSKQKHLDEACKQYQVLPENPDSPRRDVIGLAYHLVTFAVATQRLYSTLAMGILFSSRRPLRDPARHAASAKSLAGTIGRIFALHLKAAVPLWDVKVLTMGNGKVVAAWDYLRGILIEIKGTFFEESRRNTLSLLLKSFLEAGGADALTLATRPASLAQAATMVSKHDLSNCQSMEFATEDMIIKLETAIRERSLSIASALLAVNDAMDRGKASKNDKESKSGISSDSDFPSMDSVSNQARGISRIVVSDSVSLTSTSVSTDENLRGILSDKSALDSLRSQTNAIRGALLSYATAASVRRVAYDVWNTFCSFLNLMASCPGIGPFSELLSVKGEWTIDDIQRSSLFSALCLLSPAVRDPHMFLQTYRPNGSFVSDVLNVVHNASRMSIEIQKRRKNNEVKRKSTNIAAARPASPQNGNGNHSSPDPDLQNLVEMGFAEGRARSALRATGRRSLESAMDWLLAHAADDSGDEQQPMDAESRPSASEDVSADGEGHASRNTRTTTGSATDSAIAHGNRPNEGASGGAEVVAVNNDDQERDHDDDDDGDNDDEDADDSGDGGSHDENEGEGNNDSEDADETGVVVLDEDHAEGPVDMEEENEDAVAGSDLRRTLSANDEESNSNDGNSRQSMEGSDGQEKDEDQDEEMLDSAEEEDNEEVDAETLRMDRNERRRKREGTFSPRAGDELKSKKERYISLADSKQRLLEKSCSTDISVLGGALVSAGATDEDTISSLLNSACKKIGSTRLELSKTRTNRRATVRPVASDVFGDQKRIVFQELMKVARSIIDGANKHMYGEHLPCVAIELLTILQSDGTLSEGERDELSAAVTDGLKVALSKENVSGRAGEMETSSSSALLWAHFGGRQSRKALLSVGAPRLAYDTLKRCLSEWEVLSEQEANSIVDLEEASTKNGKIRQASVREALLAKRVMVCLLVLDAFVRYQGKDKLIMEVEENENTNNPGMPQKGDNGGSLEKMDTDTAEDEDKDTSTGENETRTSVGEGASGQMENDLELKDGSGSREVSDMDIEPKKGSGSTEEERSKNDDGDGEDDLKSIRRRANKRKSVALKTARREVGKKVGVLNNTPSTIGGVDKFEVVAMCKRVLRTCQKVEVGDCILAALQLVGSLTREWRFAERALKLGLLDDVLKLPQLDNEQTSSTDVGAVRALCKTVFRHMIEDKETLYEAMVGEIRLSGKSRPSMSVRALLGSMAPVASRDMECFTAAVASTLKSTHSRGDNIQMQKVAFGGVRDVKAAVAQRSNVCAVMSGLCELLETRHNSDGKRCGSEVQIYALETIAELVEVSEVAAHAFLESKPPSSNVDGGALDYVLQEVLPLASWSDESKDERLLFGSKGGLNGGEGDEISRRVRAVVTALCSASANAHEGAVGALERAAIRECARTEVRPGVVRGIASCIASGTRLRVLRAVLRGSLPNALAVAVRRLNNSNSSNGSSSASDDGYRDAAVAVLRALALVGQAATYVARFGSQAGDDVSFVHDSPRLRDWMTVATRDDSTPPTSYMVL